MPSLEPRTWSLGKVSLLPCHPLLLLLLTSVALVPNSSAQDVDYSQKINEYLKYTQGLKDMWESTMIKLKELTRTFINAITKDSLVTELLNHLGLSLSDASGFLNNVSTSVNSKINFNELAPKMAKAGTGYIVIIGIGIILTVFFFVGCVSMFCCRKLGCCCGKVADKYPNASDVPMIVVLSILVVGISVLLFLSAYGSIVSGVEAVDSLENDEESGIPFVGKLMKPARGFVLFLNKTLDDIEAAFNVSELKARSGSLITRLSSLIRNEIKNIGSHCTACREVIEGYRNLTAYAGSLATLVNSIDGAQIYLNRTYVEFNLTLEKFKKDTDGALGNCTNQNCQYLRRNITYLTLFRGPCYHVASAQQDFPSFRDPSSCPFSKPF